MSVHFAVVCSSHAAIVGRLLIHFLQEVWPSPAIGSAAVLTKGHRLQRSAWLGSTPISIGGCEPL